MTAPPDAPVQPPLRVGLLGLGTVGGAVAARLLDPEWRAGVAARGMSPPDLVVVGVRDARRRRAVVLPQHIESTDDLGAIVERADVDVVIELLGGIDPAGALVERALAARKPVVTANKQLLAEAGPRLESVARRSGAALRFEAAVAGGIPVLAPLARDLAANRVEGIRGIVNGTSNFILDAMHRQGSEYGAVLADAKRRGYAEADPAADVEGTDAVHKLVLLARLAFGAWLAPSAIRRTPARLAGEGPSGITGVDGTTVAAARHHGLVIKLVASISGGPSSGSEGVSAWVEPCAVVGTSTLGTAPGVSNVIEIRARPLGLVSFRGPGAGGDATSSAVLADLLALARTEGSTWATLPEALLVPSPRDGRDEPARWFHVGPDGRGSINGPASLGDVRARLTSEGMAPDTTIYRVLEED